MHNLTQLYTLNNIVQKYTVRFNKYSTKLDCTRYQIQYKTQLYALTNIQQKLNCNG